MATIRKEFIVRAAPTQVWEALRDFPNVHRRLAAGFVTDSQAEEDGAVRHITFANGLRVRERLVGIDEAGRRMAYTAQGGRTSHHNASAQVLDDGEGRTRFVWITDMLPDTLAPAIEQMMDAGAKAMTACLEDAAQRA